MAAESANAAYSVSAGRVSSPNIGCERSRFLSEPNADTTASERVNANDMPATCANNVASGAPSLASPTSLSWRRTAFSSIWKNSPQSFSTKARRTGSGTSARESHTLSSSPKLGERESLSVCGSSPKATARSIVSPTSTAPRRSVSCFSPRRHARENAGESTICPGAAFPHLGSADSISSDFI